MSDLPRLALSVRQPWAWAIVHGHKDIENRSWQAVNWGLNQRGRVCIHAAKGMSREEYEDARDFMGDLGVTCPPAVDLIRGAIVGSVEVVDVVNKSDNPWFVGSRGLVLRNPELWSPIPCIGQLGYFDWRRAEIEPPPPAKWMLPPAPKPVQQALPIAPATVADDDLFAVTPPADRVTP